MQDLKVLKIHGAALRRRSINDAPALGASSQRPLRAPITEAGRRVLQVRRTTRARRPTVAVESSTSKLTSVLRPRRQESRRFISARTTARSAGSRSRSAWSAACRTTMARSPRQDSGGVPPGVDNVYKHHALKDIYILSGPGVGGHSRCRPSRRSSSTRRTPAPAVKDAGTFHSNWGRPIHLNRDLVAMGVAGHRRRRQVGVCGVVVWWCVDGGHPVMRRRPGRGVDPLARTVVRDWKL